jgi:HAD superfamily hydrolase (TIGR01509 family)
VIDCILFDSDGTLVDSEPLSFVVLAEMMAPYGAVLDPHELHLRYRGWKMGEVFEILAAENGIKLPSGFEPEFRAEQIRQFESSLKPIPGVPELLPRLEQDMAVVTSGPLPKVKKALAVTGLDGYFGDRIYSAFEVGVWKPDPGIYRHAARDMGYDIERCLAVEDSPIGLEAAATCGAVPVFLNRYGDHVEYEHVVEIRSMSELPRVLASLGESHRS